MAPVITVPGFRLTEDVLFAEAYDEIKREIWVLVAQRIAHEGGRSISRRCVLVHLNPEVVRLVGSGYTISLGLLPYGLAELQLV